MGTDVMSPRGMHSLGDAGSSKHPENTKPRLPPMSIPMPIPAGRNGQLTLDVFSPVNQNGSFEFDRVLKSGHVYKRSRKTKQWKKFYLVLRPNLLSMYRNESEEKLLKQVNLSDLTAINILKDPKGRRDHMFGLFTPSHNYHFQAGSDTEAQAWVDLLRKEARIDEEEESMILGSPPLADSGFSNFGPGLESNMENGRFVDRLASSSPEPLESQPLPRSSKGLQAQPILNAPPRQLSLNELDYSGQEHASYSDFSDGPAAGPSSPRTNRTGAARATKQTFPLRPGTNSAQIQSLSTSAPITSLPETIDPQRILWQGHLLLLRSTRGVRSWKRFWAVLRPAHLAFYKNENEYSINLLLPLSSILSAIEIDPLSKSKKYCMQIITEDRNYRVCLGSEESVARCLGAVKSLLARRKGAGLVGGAGAKTDSIMNPPQLPFAAQAGDTGNGIGRA